MILYKLRCSREHEFDVWFRDSAAYDEQKAAKAISCPLCGDGDVSKAIMAPRVSSSRDKTPERPAAPSPDHRRESPAATYQMGNAEAMHMLAALRKHIEETCDYVGDRFPEEARRIYYGETEEHSIYGEATDEEAAELLEEGIPIGRIPRVRYDA